MDPLATRRIAERFSRLTDEQRRTVYQKIRAEGMTLGQFPILARDPSVLERSHLSYAQLRQWFLWQLDPGSTAYHISGALSLSGDLDVGAVRASFAALVQRHEALRTVFRANADGVAEQLIRDSAAFAIEEIDLATVPEADRDASVHEQALRLSETAFDLGEGPLLRVGLIRRAEREHVLVVVMHHIVSDGWSLQIIVDEFVAQYRARVLHTPIEPKALPIQYADYAVWQKQWLEQARRSGSWRTGRSTWAASTRCCSCRPTIRGARTAATEARGWTWSCPRSWRGRCSGARRARGRPCSWCCWRGCRCCCRATPGSRTSAWACRSPTATGWRRRA